MDPMHPQCILRCIHKKKHSEVFLTTCKHVLLGVGTMNMWHMKDYSLSLSNTLSDGDLSNIYILMTLVSIPVCVFGTVVGYIYEHYI